MPLLELRDVSRRFPGVGDAEGPEVLRGITTSLEEGEAVAILGPSGSGKSTLLNLMGGLDRPTSGQVLLDGRDLSELDDQALAQVRNQEVGFVFQAHHLLPQCTALENVLVPTLVLDSRAARESAPERAESLLARVGLEERLHHRPAQLSGGECQRVAVVRALINEPWLLLADEPTGSLDFEAAANLADLLVDLNRKEGVTLVVVTHSVGVAKQIRQIVRLIDGQLAGSRMRT